ncbi:disintegrin and metalloproteinase domain-containing protein 17 [Plakobranchus ocellatus]|uniref:Disintegrin and metalloproteinase domain-containing protein 17 n=1 Tax=Plakobranchus ocellatus TaxID=259542 RepID=A0AAV4A814_9GAST|nr:disintegrin and metalloproteinase domain-containing protein 17 [Plakobranchus ocellatus]
MSRVAFILFTASFYSELNPTLSVIRETDQLSYYETLSEIAVTSRVRRSVSRSSGNQLEKELRFRAFQRNFHLTLRAGSPVLASGFRARLVHGDGGSTSLAIDQSQLFTGHLEGNAQSSVSAHLEGDLWNIQILDREEIYSVEPAWRLLRSTDNPLNHTMVTYKLSDIKNLSRKYKFCTTMDADKNRTSPSAKDTTHFTSSFDKGRNFTHAKRIERSAKDTCLMYLVADTNTFRSMCRSNARICVAMMLSSLHLADHIYRSSQFEGALGQCISGIGLQVAELALYTQYNIVSPYRQEPHFNQQRVRTAESKLTAFAKHVAHKENKYCLHHLFTELGGKTITLGQAYRNSLCLTGPGLAFSTSVSIEDNIDGVFVPTLLTRIIFTHEIGHNFGANHDPDTPKCAPTDIVGGKYLMWGQAPLGVSPNNVKFSKCSLRQIARNIPAWCFTERSEINRFCGNGVVDAGEECDAGTSGLLGTNKCCTEECLFKDNAVCCELNSECCVDCQIAPASTVCRKPGYIHYCVLESYCPGTSDICPEGENAPDGTNCSDNHVCLQGECVGPCEQATRKFSNGTVLKPCGCTQSESEMCSYCCFNATDVSKPGDCKPILPTTHSRPDGTPCHDGTCENGICRRVEVLNVVFRGKYIHFVNLFVWTERLSRNVVVSVVFLSLLVWVPASLLISRRDRRLRQKKKTGLDHEANTLAALRLYFNRQPLSGIAWPESHLEDIEKGYGPDSVYINDDDITSSQCGNDLDFVYRGSDPVWPQSESTLVNPEVEPSSSISKAGSQV